MADPVRPYLITGKLKGIYGNNIANASISLTHTTITPVLSATTSTNGEYTINLGKLGSQWSQGDSLSISSTVAGEGRITLSTTIKKVGGGQTENLTLGETSDIDFEPKTADLNRNQLVLALPILFDGTKVTREKPLPVQNVLDRVYTEKFAALSSDPNITEYHGWANPGTPTAEAKWRIRKLVYSGTFLTDILWVDGNQNFDNKWDDRTTLSYS